VSGVDFLLKVICWAPTARAKAEDVRRLVAGGLSKARIAAELGISQRPVFRVLAQKADGLTQRRSEARTSLPAQHPQGLIPRMVGVCQSVGVAGPQELRPRTRRQASQGGSAAG
jgi:hypothetical protein